MFISCYKVLLIYFFLSSLLIGYGSNVAVIMTLITSGHDVVFNVYLLLSEPHQNHSPFCIFSVRKCLYESST